MLVQQRDSSGYAWERIVKAHLHWCGVSVAYVQAPCGLSPTRNDFDRYTGPPHAAKSLQELSSLHASLANGTRTTAAAERVENATGLDCHHWKDAGCCKRHPEVCRQRPNG